MQNTLNIRPPQKADFEAWKNLWDGYNAFYGRCGETALPSAITLSTWRRFLDPSQNVFCLLVLQATEVVGLAHYLFHPNTIMIAPTCYVQDLFTDTKAQGRGVGRALMGDVIRRASESGVTSVYWHTHRSNETARALYDSIATDTDFTVYRRSS